MKQKSEWRQGWAIWLRAAALGAAAMYLFDTDRGKQRRVVARDKILSLTAKTGDAIDVMMRDVRNRLGGL